MMSTRSLYEELEERICPLTGHKYLGNLESLSKIITWPSVQKSLNPSFGRRWLWLPYWDSSPENKIPGARKVIAILVRAGQSKTIETLLSEDLTDADLPLSQKGSDLQSASRDKVFTCFRTWEPGAVERFLEKQWVVLEPFMQLNSETAINVQLEGQCALSLAFYACVEVTKDKESTAHVFKATEKPKAAGEVYVAVKKFEQRRTDAFVKERDMLKAIQEKGISNAHLIKHLAICEDVPCIIFPWADGGDLGEYWQRESPRTQDEFLWSLGQMVGLVDALKDLHKGKCRHGDLKPANILYFTENGVGVLKIADVGVSRVHEKETALRRGVTTTSASTKVYEGPEVNAKIPRSRLYDCWSMGCIILEFVLWLLYDFKAIESFLAARLSESHGYYRLVANAPNIEPLDNTEVHPAVYEAMKLLREDPRCVGTALEALVNLVDHKMLMIKPKQRREAADLHQELRAILGNAEKNPSYLVRSDQPVPHVPPIFSQPPLSFHSDQGSTFQ
ncbi:kinase-like protein [Hyaloscypha bicolor E]|uniref:Kinase-like protein n=1 Tax=Hyaloscypha bicolor E TaxID=1095630 RepID=A0A2J6T2Y8_9HELO|nr:kinase-like protein [Hyaloscypha bicolor E]PMD57283.1 kinase-like protein [Hyaloscypha bicolor E]